VKKYENEEQLKDEVFDIYSKWQTESSSDRFLIHFTRLSEQIYIWCKNYSFKRDIDNLGEEITIVVRGSMNKILDKDSFFKYLTDSINNGIASFYRKYNEKELIKIPREKKRKLRNVKDFIRMKESQLGKKLTNDERIQCVSKWFNITEKKAGKYLELIDIKYVGSLSYANNDENKEIDVVDSHSEDPLDEYITRTGMETILKVVKSLLDKKQDRSRDCYKALFTLYCVKKEITGLYPILDQEIIDSFYKESKKPKQYEIYLKYHPEVDKKSAGVQAATNLHKFLDDLENCLKNQ